MRAGNTDIVVSEEARVTVDQLRGGSVGFRSPFLPRIQPPRRIFQLDISPVYERVSEAGVEW